MKKKFIALFLAFGVAFSATVPVFACTPRYTPISKQSWYISMQSALKSIKVSVPKINITLK